MSENSNMENKYIIVSEIDNPDGLKVGLIQLNRPEVLNALSIPVIFEVVNTLELFDTNDKVGCTIITGSQKAFAAGADIKEMAETSAVEIYFRNKFAIWDRIRKIKKPIIAAVSGFALGGGCELAMNCDIIIASESAKFGQPEINLGIIPGAGATQRLTRAVGKAKAMEAILTGKLYSAKDMFDFGLITRVVSNETFLDDSINLAKEIANKPLIAVQLAKECILNSFDSTIEEGIEFERKSFYLTFASEDKFEGMKAFIEKRKPKWKNK